MNVLISRHGETDWNVSGKFQGHKDSPITQKGMIQNYNLLQELKSYNPRLIFCSDLPRAMTPAKIAAENFHVPVIESEIFRERFLGEAEGLSIEEIKSKWSSAYTGQLGAEINIEIIPGAEMRNDFEKRVIQAMHFIKKTKNELKILSHENVFLLTHGIFIIKVFELFHGDNLIKVEHSTIYKISLN